MSTYGDGGYNSQTQPLGDRVHTCNCIGCCKDCGHCNTDPIHTHAVCKQLQEIEAQRVKVFERAREKGLS